MAEIFMGTVIDQAAFLGGAGRGAIGFHPISLEEAKRFICEDLEVIEDKAQSAVTVRFPRDGSGVAIALVAKNDNEGSAIVPADWEKNPITLTAKPGQHISLFKGLGGERIEFRPSVPQA